SEAKFVSSRGYRTQAKKSAKQLEETVARLGRAIDPNHKRIDRDIWLNRIGDFMIEGMEPFDSALMNGWDLHKWSDEVRQDKIPIQLAGFSHVFVHDNDEYVDSGDATPLKGMPHCVQQVFDKAKVAGAFRSFANKDNRSEEQLQAEGCTWNDALVSTGTGSKTQVEATNTETNATSVIQAHTPGSESVERRVEKKPT
ncbi:MAG: hypothetical protein KC587_19600, partial [Nitrospira sp.]|nr:hypothetical protein [Nitrospira sp.]